MTRALAVVALLLAACGRIGFSAHSDGATADAPPAEQSGTRLKLAWYDFADGTRLVNGAYDSVLGQRCYFTAWGDGHTYCVPASSDTVYSDASCTQLVGHNPFASCLAAPAYFIRRDSLTCGAQLFHLFPATTPVSATTFYVPLGGTCAGFTARPDDAFYNLGTELPASTMVEGTPEIEPTTGRLAAVFWRSADGIRLHDGFYDTALAAPCTGFAYADGVRCVPTPTLGTTTFQDAQCSVPAAPTTTGCAPPPFMSWTPPAACSDDAPSFAATGTAVPSTAALYDNSGSCAAASPQSPGETFYGPGAAISPASLARTPETVAGRRLQLVDEAGDGAGDHLLVLYDTMLGVDCGIEPAADGQERCMPATGVQYTAGYFSDAQCTTPLAGAYVGGSPGCPAPAAPPYAVQIPACPFAGVHAAPLTGLYTGTVYANATGGCTANTFAEPFYTVGTELPATTFALATVGHDP